MKISANTGSVLHIGRVGEHNATTVVFDISKWKEENEDGKLSLLIKQNDVLTIIGNYIDSESGEEKHQEGLELNGNYVYWVVSRAFTQKSGRGLCELTYISNNEDYTIKSAIYDIVVTDSLEGDPQNPDPVGAGWVEQILNKATEAQTAANDAKTYASNAKTEKEAAISASNTTKIYLGDAEAAQAAAEKAKGEAEAAQSAAEVAQSKAEAAQSAAETAKGYAEAEVKNAQIEVTNAEAWAVGTRNGYTIEVEDDKKDDTSFPHQYNNAKYWCHEAEKRAVEDIGDALTRIEDNLMEAVDAVDHITAKTGEKIYLWIGSSAEYLALGDAVEDNTLYIVDGTIAAPSNKITVGQIEGLENMVRTLIEEVIDEALGGEY